MSMMKNEMLVLPLFSEQINMITFTDFVQKSNGHHTSCG